mgnify:CR=1 FL=1
MANEIGCTVSTAGSFGSAYAIIWDFTDRSKAYKVGVGVVTWVESDRGLFDIPLTITGCRFHGNLPTTASGLPDGVYQVEYFGHSSSPALADVVQYSEVVTVVDNEIWPPVPQPIESDKVDHKYVWQFPATGKQNESTNIIELHPSSSVQLKMDFTSDDGSSVSSVSSAVDENSDGSITLTGLAATQDKTAALVDVSGLTENKTYRIRIVCAMTNGDTVARVGHLQTVDTP